DDAAHAARLGELRDVDVVHVAAEDVGMRVHMEVDDARRRTDFRRRRWKAGLAKRLSRRERERDQQCLFHGVSPGSGESIAALRAAFHAAARDFYRARRARALP